MSLILNNNLSYDDIKILNNIANYHNNLRITNNNIYKYMKDTTNNNYLIEDDINLLQTMYQKKKVIFEALSDGPIMLLKMTAGKYDAEYTFEGKVLKRSLVVEEGKFQKQSVVWPQ